MELSLSLQRYHSFIVLWMRGHIFLKHDTQDHGALAVPCENKRSSLIIVFKIIVQSSADILHWAALKQLISLLFTLVLKSIDTGLTEKRGINICCLAEYPGITFKAGNRGFFI